jgi:hypothetical protein
LKVDDQVEHSQGDLPNQHGNVVRDRHDVGGAESVFNRQANRFVDRNRPHAVSRSGTFLVDPVQAKLPNEPGGQGQSRRARIDECIVNSRPTNLV